MDICFSIFLRCEEPYPFFWRIWGGTSTESHVKRKHDDLSWFLSFVNGFRGNPFSNASRRWWKLVGIVEQFYGTIMETITGEDANGEWTWWARFLAEQPSQKPHFQWRTQSHWSFENTWLADVWPISKSLSSHCVRRSQIPTWRQITSIDTIILMLKSTILQYIGDYHYPDLSSSQPSRIVWDNRIVTMDIP